MKELQVENYLLSFAVDAKNCDHFAGENNSNRVIIDSGAFSVWNKGGSIDIEAYKNFCVSKPQTWNFINLDVIPKTGASKADIEKCCEQGYENYLYLSKHIKNLMPVYHYGDNIKWLKQFMQHTDYIGISPANDTHENVKRVFLKQCFNITRDKVKTHGLGYSSAEGLTLFPFYSVDSISYKRIPVFLKGKRETLLISSKLDYIFIDRVNSFLKLEKEVTALWEKRGVIWN